MKSNLTHETLRLWKLKDDLIQLNKEEKILNGDPFSSFEYVIIVQVHNRFEYLKAVIENLSTIYKINRVLVIFSHDVYNQQLNHLVQNITKFRAMQVHIISYRNNYIESESKSSNFRYFSLIRYN